MKHIVTDLREAAEMVDSMKPYSSWEMRDLLLRAAKTIEGESDQAMHDRIYGPTPIDGTGWAEAAFETREEALRRCGFILKDGMWSKPGDPRRYRMSGNLKPRRSPFIGDGVGLTSMAHDMADDHFVTDELRGQGE